MDKNKTEMKAEGLSKQAMQNSAQSASKKQENKEHNVLKVALGPNTRQ